MSLFSVNTNIGALAALQSLDTTQQQVTDAQKQVSTGLKVGSASDNPAIYAISNTINSNIAGLSAVSDSLNFGAQIVSTASSALSQVSSTLANLQQTVTNSGQSGLDPQTLQNLVTADLSLIDKYASQSTFTGVNLLTNAGAGATTTTLNVVQGLDGSVLNIPSQSGASSLTAKLGIANLTIGGTSGFSVAFNQNLSVASFAPGGGADAAFQLTTTPTTGPAHTYSFEFTDDSVTGANPLQTSQNANTTIIAVHINSTNQSTNQIQAALINSLQSNGFSAQQNSDGTLNVVGSNVTAAAFGTVTAGGSLTPESPAPITTTALTAATALVSLVQSAVGKANTIAANLGAVSQQITGIQNFTTSLSSALTAGVGALTDADLAAESARLTSLQTKQQLATQSLSIANKQPQSLLSLFQGQ